MGNFGIFYNNLNFHLKNLDLNYSFLILFFFINQQTLETKLSLLLKKLLSGYDDITFKRKLCEIKKHEQSLL
jgi:hypothetical protein